MANPQNICTTAFPRHSNMKTNPSPPPFVISLCLYSAAQHSCRTANRPVDRTQRWHHHTRVQGIRQSSSDDILDQEGSSTHRRSYVQNPIGFQETNETHHTQHNGWTHTHTSSPCAAIHSKWSKRHKCQWQLRRLFGGWEKCVWSTTVRQ